MLTRTGTTTNAHRKGGPRSRSHNDDRFKGTLTGVAIPEAPRGSDGIEDFENLLESGYDSVKPSQQLRNTRHRSPNGVSNSTNMTSEKALNDDSERPASRSKPVSAVGHSTSRSMRSVDVEYAPVPSSRPNSARNGITHSPASSLRKPSPAYNSTTAHPFPTPRPSQSFGALSRYQDEQPDAEAVMEQYINYNGGALVDQDSPSPPPLQTSSPPQALRKLVHSPLAARTPKRTVDPVEDQEELNGTVSQKAKGKQRATEEPDERSPPPLSRKSNGKRRADLVDEEVDEVTPTRKTAGGRSSGDMGPPTSKSSIKNRSSTYAKVLDEAPAEEQYEDPLLDNGDHFDQNPMGMEVSPLEGEEEPPKSASEHSDAGSEEERQPATGKGKAKERKPAAKAKEKRPESKKKRPREDDEEPPRQKKKPKSTDSRATARAKSREPDPDRSYFEELQSEDENEEDEGVRRSRRAKMAPVKFWLGEKLEYDMYRPGSNRQVPEIIGVRRVPEAPAASLARRRKRGQSKGRSKSRRLESEDVQSRQVSVVRDESGWEEETVPVGTVLNYETSDEVEKLIVFTAKMVAPKLTEKGHFLYQRIFADEKFVAAGQLVIPGKSEKPKKSSKDNTYVFYLIEGVIHVIVHETKFYLAPGGMFMVPRGNHYYIRNMKDYDAKLFFVQGRLMTTDEFDGGGSRAGTARVERSPSRARAYEGSGGANRSSSKGDGLGSSSPQKRPAQRPKPTGSRR